MFPKKSEKIKRPKRGVPIPANISETMTVTAAVTATATVMVTYSCYSVIPF